MTLEQLRERKAEIGAKEQRIGEDLDALRDKCTGRTPTRAEDERLDNLMAGITRARTELDTLERIERAMTTGVGVVPGSDQGRADLAPTRTAGLGGDIRGDGLRAIEQAPGATDDQRQVATELVEQDHTYTAARWASAVAGDTYLRAFAKLVQDPQRGHLEWSRPEQEAFARARAEARSMSLADADGGFMVPFALDPSIMLTGDGSIDPIRAAARTVTTATNQWQGVTSAGVSTRWSAEGTEANDDSPTLGDAPIDVHKADSFVPYSLEIGGDAIDLVGELRRIMADAKLQHEAAAWINGTGSGQPYGIVTRLTGGSSEVAPNNAGSFTADDVYALLEKLPPRFRDRAAWLAALSTINDIDQFETANGSKRFPDVHAATPTLLRRPLAEVSNMRGTADIDAGETEDNHVLAVGDLQAAYVIADRIGTTIELIPHVFGAERRPTGERGLYMYWRVGADVVVPNALRILNVATTA